MGKDIYWILQLSTGDIHDAILSLLISVQIHDGRQYQIQILSVGIIIRQNT